MSVAGGNTIVAIICIMIFIGGPMAAIKFKQDALEYRQKELERQFFKTSWHQLIRWQYNKLRKSHENPDWRDIVE